MNAEKIRVLRLIARLNVGGPAIHTILLTRLLAPERFDSTLVTGQIAPTEGDMSYLAQEQGVEPVLIPELGREIHWKKDPVAFWKIFRVMRKLRPAIVHTHTAKAGMLGRLAAKLAGVPIIVHTFHGHVFHSYFSRPKTQAFVRIERVLARMSDAIITLSPRQREEILGYGIGRPEKVQAIGLGLPLDPFVTCASLRGQLRQELGVSEQTPLIGIVARLVPVKGHSYFLDAAKYVLETYPDARFLLIGDGELRAELEQYARDADIEKHVRFLGFRRDLPEIYAGLDVVLLSSLNEGLPVTLIEALAAATPVVAAQVGGVGDLVDHQKTGILVPPQDSRALANGVCQMLTLSASDRQKMGAAGRASVYPRYHIATLVRNIETLYQDLLRRKKNRFSR